MNSEQRKQAALRIQKVHDKVYKPTGENFNGIPLFHDLDPDEAHNHRAELLPLLADAERENDELRGYARHINGCNNEFLAKLEATEALLESADVACKERGDNLMKAEAKIKEMQGELKKRHPEYIDWDAIKWE